MLTWTEQFERRKKPTCDGAALSLSFNDKRLREDSSAWISGAAGLATLNISWLTSTASYKVIDWPGRWIMKKRKKDTSLSRLQNKVPLPVPASFRQNSGQTFSYFCSSHIKRSAAPLAGWRFLFLSSGILFAWVWTNSAIVTNKAARRRRAHASRRASTLLMARG